MKSGFAANWPLVSEAATSSLEKAPPILQHFTTGKNKIKQNVSLPDRFGQVYLNVRFAASQGWTTLELFWGCSSPFINEETEAQWEDIYFRDSWASHCSLFLWTCWKLVIPARELDKSNQQSTSFFYFNPNALILNEGRFCIQFYIFFFMENEPHLAIP